MTTRIVIADDQEMVRHGFRMILDAQPDMRVVGEASDGAKAVETVRSLRPDVLLADIRMPVKSGLDVVRELAADPVKVVVVTTFDIDEYVHSALRDGAAGFLLKRSGPGLLAEAVRAAVAGDALISPSITVRLLRHLRAPGAAAPPKVALTERETEVARLVATGETNAEIGARLFITAGTVKTHLAGIQRKTGARNRVNIATWAWQAGLADPDA
ncbi:response regulator transcription factor [Phytomonospora sp. NPDC050363]|uniref:response regulator transcription factor n=1 Tax=Phytomonospora sp. NPDC050363 TaxID=3155642 RepID=UPI00340D0E2F